MRSPVGLGRGFVPRFYVEGKHTYAHCDYCRLRWKVIGIVSR